MKKRILLKDIAEKLNITTNTVSRALNDKPDISESTKEEVRRVAEEIGYIPDIIASSMRTSCTKTVAVLFDNMTNPYFMIMANAIENHLHDNDYQMMIFTVKTNAVLTMDIFKKMVSRKVDGVITFLRPEQKVADLANNMHLPILVVGREADDLNLDSIFTDDVSGGYLMGQYFYKKGYKTVGYLGGPVDIKCSLKRAEGITDYCKEYGLTIHTRYEEWADKSIIYKADELVESGVEALFCFNDSIAYTLMSHFKTNYPEKKIEVTGYDNIANQLQLPIKITTIGTNTEKIASICANRMMSKIGCFDQDLLTEIIEVKIITN